MKIVVNHLTRMQKGCMCVAGLDLATGRHVRPMLQSQMRTSFLARHGGPFEMGAIVDLGWTKRVGQRPEIEDHLFHRSEARQIGDMAAGEFWQMLEAAAQPKLRLIFGDDLQQRGRRSYGVDVGKGAASLGCYVAASRPQLCIQRRGEQSRGRIRIEFSDGQYDFELGMTDVRLYGDDHVTPDDAVVQRTNQRLQSAAKVILSVGLTRPFRSTDDQSELHWLQVNNIHCQDDPCWRLD